MGEEGMRIGFDPDKYFGELPGWDVIDVDHDEPGITGNVCGGTSACERDRSDKGRLGLFDLFFFCFQLREKQIIVLLFRLVQTGNCLPIQFGLRFMKQTKETLIYATISYIWYIHPCTMLKNKNHIFSTSIKGHASHTQFSLFLFFN